VFLHFTTALADLLGRAILGLALEVLRLLAAFVLVPATHASFLL